MARYSPGQAGLVQSSPNIFSAFLLVWSSPSFLDRLCSVRGVLQSTDVWRPDCFSSNSINFFSTEKAGNDSNLLIVFYVQIMPDDFVMQLTDFENDDDFRPSRARCCLRFRLCRSIRCVYRLLITCSFPSGGIHTAASHPSSISPRQRVTAGS